MSSPIEQRVAAEMALDAKRSLARAGTDLDPDAERALLEVALRWVGVFGEGLIGPVSLARRR